MISNTPRFKTLVNKYRQDIIDGIKIRLDKISRSSGGSVQSLRDQVQEWSTEIEEFDEHLPQHILKVRQPLISDKDSKRVDIIVLKYKDPEVEEKCILNLVKYTDWPHKITWYDSRNQSANFSKLWNHLTKVSTCDYVLIMDSDAYVEEGWLSKMMSSFEAGFMCQASDRSATQVTPSKVGLVIPVTHKHGAHTIQGLHRAFFGKIPFLARTQVSGFFFLFKKEMFNDIGAFDEEFYLHGQDSEWVDRILDSDWEMVVRGDVFVDHTVSASISAATKRNEFHYRTDIQYTQMVYKIRREEKREGVYVVPR